MILLKYDALVGRELRNRFVEAIRAFVEPIRVEEGCLDYKVCEWVNDSEICTITLCQVWETEELLKAHVASTRFGLFLQTLELLRESPIIEVFHISEKREIGTIEEFLKAFQ